MRRFFATHGLDIGLCFVVLVWGSSPTIFKFALNEVAPLTFVMLRFLLLSVVSCVGLLLYARRRPEIKPFRIRRQDIWLLIVSGLSGYGIYQLFYIEGLSRTTAFASSLFTATAPLWSAVILQVFGIERIRPMQWLGIVVSLVGVAWFLAAAPASAHHVALERGLTPGGIILGDALSLAGAACFALYGVVNKRLTARYSPAELMCYTLLIGTIALLPFGVMSLVSQDWSHVTWRLWVIVPYSVLFPIYLTYSIWNWAIGRRGVGYVTLYSYASPVLGGITAFLVLREPIGVTQALAAAVVVGGMLMARWAIMRRRKASERPRVGTGESTALAHDAAS